MIVTLLTDFGTSDAYVAQMKGQILSIAPKVQLIDVTHEVEPQNVAQGAWLLAQSVGYFPEDTVHLAIVDPGVGTARQMLAVEAWIECEANEPCVRRQRLVLPDNGLVELVRRRAVKWTACALTNRQYWRSVVSSTFHGRDVMGPVAAHWAAGAEQTEFGPPCGQLEPLVWPEPEIETSRARGQILAMDHFGNLVTNLPAHIAPSDTHWPWSQLTRVTLKWDQGQCLLAVARTYGEHPQGQPLILPGSQGMIEIAIAGGHAGQQLSLQPGAQITLQW